MVEDEALLEEDVPGTGSDKGIFILLFPDFGKSLASQTSSLGSSSSHTCDRTNRPDTSCDVPVEILQDSFILRETSRSAHYLTRIRTMVFWVVTPRSIAGGYQCFKGTCNSHIQCISAVQNVSILCHSTQTNSRNSHICEISNLILSLKIEATCKWRIK
jgi:hypothetical protein